MNKNSKGQSAIEYLATYGWMLLVVAIAGAAVFSLIGERESKVDISGFGDDDLKVTEFETANDGNLSVQVRHLDRETASIKSVNLSTDTGDKKLELKGDKDVGSIDANSFQLCSKTGNITAEEATLEIVYDGQFNDLISQGEIIGDINIQECGSSSSGSDGGSSSVADFNLSSVSDNGSITEGGNLGVDYNVENIGGDSGTQDIVLKVNGSQKDVNSSVSLDSGDSSSGTLIWNTSVGNGSGSSYPYKVLTDNETVSESVNIDSLEGPTANASANTTTVEVGETIKFIGSNSTEEDAIDTYNWTFGDGNNATGENTTHSYSSTGTYNAELNATDTNNLSDTDNVTINVTGTSFFNVSITDANSSVTEGETVYVDYEVNNTGAASGEQEVNLTVNKSSIGEVDNETISLNSGGNATGTFNWITSDGDAGDYNLTVKSNDNNENATLTIESSIIDAFEDNDMSEYTKTDTSGSSFIKTDTSASYKGSYGLRSFAGSDDSDGNPDAESYPGDNLNSYPENGDKITYYQNLQSGNEVVGVLSIKRESNAEGPRIFFSNHPDRPEINFKYYDGSSYVASAQANPGINLGEWYKVEVKLVSSDLNYRLYDKNGNKITDLALDTEVSEANDWGIGVTSFEGDNDAADYYVDTIKAK